MADCKVPRGSQESLLVLAQSVSQAATMIATTHSLPNEAWPYGANWMFRTTLKWQSENPVPFYWLEPDCTPLKRGWLGRLEDEYFQCGKPFMGGVVHSSGTTRQPGDHLTGCAIYPENAHKLLGKVLSERHDAFDMAIAHIAVPLAHHTDLFFHSWGARATTDPSRISPQAVIHHQCKDGSLINRLRKQL